MPGSVVDKTVDSENADNLKVIGRPGVGVDNVDLETATEKNARKEFKQFKVKYNN